MAAVVASGTSHSGYTLTVNKPNGTAEGDLLIALVASDGDNITLGAPGGWTALDAGYTGNNRTVRAFGRIASGSEPGSYTFTSSSSNSYRVCMVRVDGAPTTGPVIAGPSWNGANNGNSTQPIPQLTAPTGGALQLGFIAYNSPNSPNATQLPSGWTSPHALSNTDANCLIASRQVAAGTTPAASFSTAGSTYSWTTGTVLISSGQVVSVSRSSTPTATVTRGVVKSFAASVAAAGALVTQRVVVRLFEAVIGGATTTTDGMVDDFPDSFSTTAGQSGQALGADLIKVPLKLFTPTISTYGGYAKVTQKVLESSITVTGFSRRVIIRVFRATITPNATFSNANIGRLFGAPGIVDITVRLAGEIRARVRRR